MKKQNNNIGRKIKEKRLELGWTQERLAKEIGYSRIWVLKVEKGQIKSPGINGLDKIRVRMGMAWEDLWK
jgi:transcriptional regulator with XRE-family HTH domain